MLGTEIELLISDFDGTLVDTFSANYMAYQKAFAEQGLCLSESQYRACFGFRFDEFMKEVGVVDVNISSRIRELKSVYYPFFFDYLNVNKPLLHFIEMFHVAGGKTAIASTARKKNLINALAHIGVLDTFDYVLAGEDVDKGKPSPEIYLWRRFSFVNILTGKYIIESIQYTNMSQCIYKILLTGSRCNGSLSASHMKHFNKV